MPTMNVQAVDPNCPTCVAATTVELLPTDPVHIRVHIVLGAGYPPAGHTMSSAKLKYSVGNNSKVQDLGPPLGPPWGDWDPGAAFTIEFDAESWLKPSDFPTTSARLDTNTNQNKKAFQTWYGVEGG
jgi:hypothetical protein